MLHLLNLHSDKDILFDVIVSCSVLHTFLPPWDADAFQPFPTFQKYYKLVIYIIGYVGINARSTVYKSISVSNNNGHNVVNGVNEANEDKGNASKKSLE